MPSSASGGSIVALETYTGRLPTACSSRCTNSAWCIQRRAGRREGGHVDALFLPGGQENLKDLHAADAASRDR